MKIKNLVFAILFFAGDRALAQCNPAVPSNAVVVNFTDTINGGFDPIWVCGGDSIHTDGGFHNIFLESGAVMTSGGGIDTIYVKPGASFFMNGGIHVIYFVNHTDVHIAGGIPTIDSCVTLAFDYTNAPSNGCIVGPLAAFASSDSAFCVNSCISFSNQSINATSYQWSFPGAIPDTGTLQNPATICYNTPGSYAVTLIAFNNNLSDTFSIDSFITVYPTPVISVLTPTLCEGDSGWMIASGAESYDWSPLTGLSVTSGDSVIAFPTQSATYTVTATDSNGCVNIATTAIIVNPLPAIPTITQQGDTLFSSQGIGYNYQWYFGSNMIAGATNNYFIATQSGDYSVVVTDTKGCQSTGVISNVIIGIKNIFDIQIQFTISPNPASNNFIIQTNSALTNAQIEIYDLLGLKIYNSDFSFINSQPMHLSTSSGIYFVKIISGEREWMNRLVIEK